MLWLCLHFPRLPLEALARTDQAPLAVTARRGSRRWILAANRDDPALAPGTDAGAALAQVPGLRLAERNPRAERAALKAAAAVAYRYGQPVTLRIAESGAPYASPFAAAWVEVGASRRLFGGLEPCVARLRADLVALGHAHAIGIAPTPEAAALLARAGVETPVPAVRDLRAALAPLPLPALALPEEVLAAVHGAGLRTVGEVLALPRDGWARRFAADTLAYLDRLTGRSPDPRRHWHPPPRYERRFEFEGEVETSEGLLFALRRVLQEFAEYLRARDTGVQDFLLRLTHSGLLPTTLDVRLVAPTRDPAHLWLVARERLERASVAAPVQEMHVLAQRFAEADAPQFDLFDTRARADGEWQQLLEKLVARLGPEAVRGLGLTADHRPEKVAEPFPAPDPPSARAQRARNRPFSPEERPGIPMNPKTNKSMGSDTIDFPPRPTWLLVPPRPLTRLPDVVGEPERIESGWWDGAGAQRDYYTAETGTGARLWVYREHGSKRWFLHGLWA